MKSTDKKQMVLTDDQAMDLLHWYQLNHRDLPWRRTSDPYAIWISEIMLQQTRVSAVQERYLQFMQELPDIRSLAECPQERLMKLWEGMGYYSRARNLQKCAVQIMQEYNGHFPEDPSLLEKLPGIGPYTAGAIASFAWQIPAAAADGNVMRVLFRLKDDSRDTADVTVRRETSTFITEFLRSEKQTHPEQPLLVSGLNQGLMELGAIVCIPNGAPHCSSCPWQMSCRAHLLNHTDSIPHRAQKPERRIVNRTLFIIRDTDHFLMRRRPDKGLLAGLYEFPGIDKTLSRTDVGKEMKTMHLTCSKITRLQDSVHIFTHLEWHMSAYEILCEDISSFREDPFVSVTKKELADLAVPSAFRVYLEYCFHC